MMSFNSVVIVSFMRKKRIRRHIRVVELAFLPIKNDKMIPTYVDSIEENTTAKNNTVMGSADNRNRGLSHVRD